ncbi:MAG: divalent metal cation transporter [Candidatus Peregrinibacteria bacterium]
MLKFKRFFKAIGPGFITGSADDDPSGIATYAQTGAQFGYTQLWFALFVTPFMIAVQEMCGRIGLVTGRGLSGVIRTHYGKPLLLSVVSLLLVANTVNIGADLGAMAASAELVFGLPFAVWLIVMTVGTLLLEVFIPYRVYVKFLKYLTLSLLAYVLAAFAVTQPWWTILKATLIPAFSFSEGSLMNIVALFGTTVSPYLFFWQADEEVEEEVAHHRIRGFGFGRPYFRSSDLADMRTDTAVGMCFSNLITFFIITTAASTLGAGGIRVVATADQAALALRPLAGDFAYLLFALGIIGTGLLAVPVLAGSASYALSEAFGWKEGLYRKFSQAHGFYGVMTLATFLGLLVNFTGLPPFRVLYFAAVLNGIVAPILLFVILQIANNATVMGKNVNGRVSNVLGWMITVMMALASVSLIKPFL